MFFTLFSCNEESLIEGRVADNVTILDLNINHNATKTAGSNGVAYPININNENLTLIVYYNYTINSNASGSFNCLISFQNTYKFATINSTAKVYSENTEIIDSFFTGTNNATYSSNLIFGLYNGNLTTNPTNWNLINATQFYSSPYNGVTFTNLNNGYLIFTSDDNTIKGWLEYQIYKDKIVFPRLGYRKWGKILTGN